jgi:hypothetical protein
MDPMDWEFSSPPFRFLDLPPELRNTIYQYYLQDSHDYQLDITKWREFVPSPSITAVSRQVRQEVISYYTPALSDFWKNHFWYLELTASLREDDVREAVLSTMHAVPKTASIRELQFSTKKFRHPRRDPISFIMGVTIDGDGRARWSFRALDRPPVFMLFVLQAWLSKLDQRAEAHHISLTSVGDTSAGASARLNVGNCVQVVMGKLHKDDWHFDDVAMFLQE